MNHNKQFSRTSSQPPPGLSLYPQWASYYLPRSPAAFKSPTICGKAFCYYFPKTIRTAPTFDF